MGEGYEGLAGPWARCKATGDGRGPPGRKSGERTAFLWGRGRGGSRSFLSLNFLIDARKGAETQLIG